MKEQNQAMRIITGAMKTTPIQELAKVTSLQPVEDIRVWKQAKQFKG